jgi:hypothetical protein
LQLAEGGGGLGGSAIVPLTLSRSQIAKRSGSRKSEAKLEEDEPDDGSEGHHCGGHWPSLLRS